MCQLLIDNGANVNYVSSSRETALYAAAYNDHYLTCKLLIESGADYNFSDYDNGLWSIIHVSIWRGNIDLC